MSLNNTSTIGLTASRCEGLAQSDMCTDLPLLIVGRSIVKPRWYFTSPEHTYIVV
jgi:hypothetical protein